MSAPKWCADYAEVVRLAEWLVKHEDYDAAQLLDYLGSPWHYDNERKLMLGKLYRCADCEAMHEPESESREEKCSDAALNGEDPGLYCPDCEDQRRAEAAADAAEADAEMRMDDMLTERGL